MPLCLLQNLQKIYPNGKKALKNLSLTIEEGDFFALLGQNGAGKTTTISILTGLIQKTAGTVLVGGFNIDTDATKVKSLIGVVPQEFNFFPFAKIIDIITDQAGYYGISYADCIDYAEYLLKKLSLWDKKDAEARTLSGGMKRRLMIARGLIHKPKLLLLDEPTAGVDVELRRGMWDFLKTLHADGTTIVLTTHYLEEVEQLCNRLAIVANGKIVKEGNVKDIIASHAQQSFVLLVSASFCPSILPAEISKKSAQEYVLTLYHSQTLMSALINLEEWHPHIISISPCENVLENLLIDTYF